METRWLRPPRREQPTDPDALQERRPAIEKQLDALTASVWSVEAKAKAGAVVYLAFGRAVEVERGLIRAEDVEAEPDVDEDEAESEAKAGPPALSASLIEDLTAQKAVALRIETARNAQRQLR